MSRAPAKRDGSPLCIDCGLCCDGTLYGQARSAVGEGPDMAAAGLDTFELDGHSAFKLPCPRLDGMCCTIYETRFHVCRTFACKLLRRYRAGEVELDEARGTVAEAKRLRERLCAIAPEAGARKERIALRRANHWRATTEREARVRGAQLELEINIFDRFLAQKFRFGNEADQRTKP